MITHAVFFKFPTEHENKIRTAQQGLKSLLGQIPQIQSLSVGINIIPSQRAYDLCLIATFSNLEDLADYREHPIHQAVARKIDEYCQSTVSVDCEM